MVPAAIDVADALLFAAAAHAGAAVVLEPSGAASGASTATLEAAAGPMPLGVLPRAEGDAVCMRLAHIAGVDPHSAQLARVPIIAGDGAGDGPRDVWVSLRPAPGGLAAELRCFAGAPAAGANPPGYVLHGEIGRGATGVVYRAEHALLGRPVAIKMLHADLGGDGRESARFLPAARMASRVRHPNVVEVLDFGVLPGGRAYLVMEMVTGRTLAHALEDGAIGLAWALELCTQLAAALEAVHAAGVVHRDVKPGNLFLDANGTLKLGDFGGSKLLQRTGADPATTQPGYIVGTPYYMSPEHARGRPTDARTDLYALGCVLYEMLTGSVPFDGDTAADVLARHITAPIPRPRGPHGAFPRAVERIVTRALAKRTRDRYQTATEVRADLERVAATLARPGWRRWLP